MQVRTFLVIVSSLLLFGCATPKFSEAEFPQGNADVEIVASQQEIEARPSQTNPGAAGGGLIGVLVASAVDNTRNRRADDALMPIRDLLIDYPLGERFAEKVRSSDVPARLVVNADPTLRVDEQLISELELTRPLLQIRPKVHFENDMSALLVDLSVVEWLPNGQGGRPKVGVGQSYHFIWPLEVERSLKREEAAARWAQWSRDDLVALIERGMDETLQMFAANLEQPVLRFADERTRIRIAQPATYRAGSYRLWRASDDLKWISMRSEGTRILAVPEHAIR